MSKVEDLDDVADLLEDEEQVWSDADGEGGAVVGDYNAASLRHEIAAVLRGEDGAEAALIRRADEIAGGDDGDA